MFVDRVEVTFKAGDGGDGVASFRHEKFRPLGGPDGGDGGNGGDIVLVASTRENTLASFRYKKSIKAGNGQNGASRKKHGKNAPALEVKVPVGTVVQLGEEAVADLSHDGEKFTIAHGGKGGFGNAHFVSSTRQAPRVAEKGENGDEVAVTLELKMIADVGIVGLPNAGKSTLLAVVSNAKPEIANYPFTTLRPNLGVVDIDEQHSILFADIPGLIEGASQGKGLGDEFLRHIERTVLLLHLIDSYSDNVVRDYKIVNQELADYKVNLSDRPQIVVLTKIEGQDQKQLAKKLATLKKAAPAATPVIAISAHSGDGIKPMLRLVVTSLNKAVKKSAKNISEELPVIALQPSDDDWQVKKDGEDFVITGNKIERFASRTRFGDFHGQQRLRDIMAKMGITRQLERDGIKPGHTIIFGEPEIDRLEF